MKENIITASWDYDTGIELNDDNFNKIDVSPGKTIELYPVSKVKETIEKTLEELWLYQIEQGIPVQLRVDMRDIMKKNFDLEK